MIRLIDRIKAAIASGKVEYWERKGNLPRADFDEAFQRNPELLDMRLNDRESGDGVHGMTGEDYVYSGKVKIEAFGKAKYFYLKFFFWEKDDPKGEQGIEVQSFKP